MLELFTVILSVVGGVYFLRDGFQVNTLNNIFLVLLFYYSLCVPLDLLFGINIHTNSRLFFVDLNQADNSVLVLYSLFLYLIFAISYVFSYRVTKPSVPCGGVGEFYVRILPKLSSVVIWNIILFAVYTLAFYGVTRTNKVLLIQSDLSYKIYSLGTILLFCLNSYFIFFARKKSEVKIVTAIAMMGVLLTGGRTIVVYFLFLYFLRFSPNLNMRLKVSLSAAAMVFFIFFKGVYANVLNILKGYPLTPLLSDTYAIGLSRVEGVMSFSILSTVVQRFDFESPYMFLENLQTLFQTTFFRGAFSSFPETLAERYLDLLAPAVAQEGGGIAFSGILNLWLDAGFLGVFLGGLVFGYLLKKADTIKGSLWIPIALMIVIRFLRSDFASMYKRFVVINGGVLILMVCFLYLWFKLNRLNWRKNGR